MESLGPEAGALDEQQCPACGGAYLPHEGVERLAAAYLSLTPSQLRELVAFVPKRALACPDCGEDMASLSLKGVALDYCAACASIWLDAGELHRITGGEHGAPAPTRSPPAADHAVPRATMTEEPTAPFIAPGGRKTFVTGVVIAVVVFVMPFTRFVFSYLNILVHELGHTLTAWSLGFPALPSFDFRYGGGVTHIGGRSTALTFFLYGLFAFLLWRQRSQPRGLALGLALLAAYSLVALTPLNELLWLAMGHGAELLVAGLFLYRGLTGRAIKTPAERPLYVACAVFMLLINLDLAWGLITSAQDRQLYAMCKGGVIDGDLIRLAKDHLGASLQGVASLLLLACLATPVASYLFCRNVRSLPDRAG